MRHVNVDSFSQGAKGLKYSLMECIYEALQEEFNEKELSGNLKNSIKIEESANVIGATDDNALLYGDSDYTIVIEAQRYDIQIYRETGQIVHTNYKRAGGSERRNKSIIKRLREGKTIDEIWYEDAVKNRTKKYSYDDNLAGSYAEEVDITGGFSKDHKDYVERCIRKGIQKWAAMHPDLDISSNL